MNRFSTICIDANLVIRYLLFPEDAVQDLWNTWDAAGVRLVAPTLLYYEVANGLFQYPRGGHLKAEIIHRAYETALILPILLVGDGALHRRAMILATTYRLPAVYDAHYLALAERLGIELWTTDVRLVKALKPFGVDWVRLAGHRPAGE